MKDKKLMITKKQINKRLMAICFLMFFLSNYHAQKHWEVASGLNIYFPEYHFLTERGMQTGILSEVDAGLSPFLDGIFFKNLNRKWQLGIGLRVMMLPTRRSYWTSNSSRLRNSVPPNYFYAGVPVALRYRINYLFSVEMGWYSANFLNFHKVLPLLRGSLNSSDFAFSGAFLYHLGRMRVGLRYLHSVNAFSQYDLTTAVLQVRSELWHRNFQVLVAWQWEQKKKNDSGFLR